MAIKLFELNKELEPVTVRKYERDTTGNFVLDENGEPKYVEVEHKVMAINIQALTLLDHINTTKPTMVEESKLYRQILSSICPTLTDDEYSTMSPGQILALVYHSQSRLKPVLDELEKDSGQETVSPNN